MGSRKRKTTKGLLLSFSLSSAGIGIRRWPSPPLSLISFLSPFLCGDRKKKRGHAGGEKREASLYLLLSKRRTPKIDDTFQGKEGDPSRAIKKGEPTFPLSPPFPPSFWKSLNFRPLSLLYLLLPCWPPARPSVPLSNFN